MAYTTEQLITNAYYTSGIVSREFETVSGGQVIDGLRNLNQLIADKTVEQGLIPYFEEYSFNGVPNTEKYFIPDLIDIDTFTFYINDVRYSTVKQQRRDYFGSARAENIDSLPFTWHLERQFNGASIYMYFKPNLAYPMVIWGQFRLSSVALNQDLSLTLDQFYINFLEYELADRLCEFNNFSTPPNVAKRLAQYQQNISKRSTPIDLRMTKMSNLTRNRGINYADINLGRGWRP